MGQEISNSFSSIGEILEGVLVDDYENMGAHDRARTQILMDQFSSQRAPFRNLYLESYKNLICSSVILLLALEFDYFPK